MKTFGSFANWATMTRNDQFDFQVVGGSGNGVKKTEINCIQARSSVLAEKLYFHLQQMLQSPLRFSYLVCLVHSGSIWSYLVQFHPILSWTSSWSYNKWLVSKSLLQKEEEKWPNSSSLPKGCPYYSSHQKFWHLFPSVSINWSPTLLLYNVLQGPSTWFCLQIEITAVVSVVDLCSTTQRC